MLDITRGLSISPGGTGWFRVPGLRRGGLGVQSYRALKMVEDSDSAFSPSYEYATGASGGVAYARVLSDSRYTVSHGGAYSSGASKRRVLSVNRRQAGRRRHVARSSTSESAR